jgi:tetratricopeptide (TPR) repeat protein
VLYFKLEIPGYSQECKIIEMKKIHYLLLIAVLSIMAEADVPCRQEIISSAPFPASANNFTEQCFVELIASRHDTVPFIVSKTEEYARYNQKFGIPLLTALSQYPGIKSDAVSARKIVAAWERYNGLRRDVVNRWERDGAVNRLDSLCRALDALASLDAPLGLAGMRAGNLKGDYERVGRLACRLAQRHYGMLPAMMGQLSAMMLDADTSGRKSIIRSFAGCAFSTGDVDSAFIIRWLTDAYRNAGMVAEQKAFLVQTAFTADVAATRLLASARRYLDDGMALEALSFAQAAARYEIVPSAASAAAVAFEASIQMGYPDTALIWFARAGLTDVSSTIKAVMCAQKSHQAPVAERLLQKIPPGIASDTLHIRQYLFAVNISEAQKFFNEVSQKPYWKNAAVEQKLWAFRLKLFGKGCSIDAQVADTVQRYLVNSPAQQREILEDRWALMLAGGLPDMCGVWSQIRFARFTGTTADYVPVFIKKDIDSAAGVAFAGVIAEALLDEKKPDQVVAFLGKLSMLGPASFVCMGRAYTAIGDTAQARKMFETVLAKYSQDVSARKARIYLQDLNR